MSDITIPPEAVQAAAYQVCKGAGDDFVCKVMCDGCKDVARQALIDALHAWPGMVERHFPNDPAKAPTFILPLPTEKSE